MSTESTMQAASATTPGTSRRLPRSRSSWRANDGDRRRMPHMRVVDVEVFLQLERFHSSGMPSLLPPTISVLRVDGLPDPRSAEWRQRTDHARRWSGG